MKNFILNTFALSLLTCSSVFGQITLTLQPDAISGKDAILDSRTPARIIGNSPDFIATAWTNGGTQVITRALVEFDLSSIPQNSIITTAALSLYGYTSTSNVGHSTQSGSNESVLKRITQNWNEQSVNWSNQPTTSALNEVTLLQSTSVNQHYLNINVVNLVQDMVNDTANSHGFMLKLKTEQYYRSILFASSDNTNSAIRPKLVVTYTLSTGLKEANANNGTINLYPNPVSGENIFLELNDFSKNTQTIQILNGSGAIVQETTVSSEKISLNLQKLATGIYIVRVSDGKTSVSKRFIRQ